ncbi:Glycine receptor subunit alpha-3 [Desmophyllum pertusum]|uniref:Glycine receptor subunit alpha-3 n=1 Tax=Desmophyllum pertusum TaxID=174260 RepID=A0A9X0CXA9_9CNID|nr:Glycine receptor subunit alpha-3 [Desmophyllum pertusum]
MDENRAKDVEELFRGRIEAPNKTHILDNIFKGYDNRVRPYYREKPTPVSLYAVIDSFHDIKEDQMRMAIVITI